MPLIRQRFVVPMMLVVAGAIHIVPVLGVLGAERLASMYGTAIVDPNLAILMRHRAVLFGLLGTFLVYAAFRPHLQNLALFSGFASVVSFLWLAWSVGNYNDLVARVVAADLVALGSLVIGVIARARERK